VHGAVSLARSRSSRRLGHRAAFTFALRLGRSDQSLSPRGLLLELFGIAPAQARLGGADPIILLTYIIGFNFSVIARPPVQQPGDLRGKRVGVNRFGAGTDFGARIALKRWGLVPVKDVTIIQLGGYPEAFVALKGDSVQAAVLAPPFSTEAKRLGMVELIDFLPLTEMCSFPFQ
jgi:ABC-type amino acid transport substrate-binding protein